jgi:hypothetical protein
VHSRTQATLQELEKAEWFSALGLKDAEAAIVLSSWEETINCCASDAWQDLLLEAANQYREKVASHSKDRFKEWNLIVRELKEVTVPLVASKIEPVVREHQIPKIFEDTVNWDILHAAMEAEYADVYPPGFFASQAYWYVQGHFPCGWQGVFPDGKLIIY